MDDTTSDGFHNVMTITGRYGQRHQQSQKE
jgi:hypothetical protein